MRYRGKESNHPVPSQRSACAYWGEHDNLVECGADYERRGTSTMLIRRVLKSP